MRWQILLSHGRSRLLARAGGAAARRPFGSEALDYEAKTVAEKHPDNLLVTLAMAHGAL
jgi:hypothetical protein